MRLAVAYSTGDPAGRGAAQALARLLSAKPAHCPMAVECFRHEDLAIAGFKAEAVKLEILDATPDPQAEAVIVLSKHRAESGRKSLTVHHPGNPTSDNSLGGRPRELAVAYPALAKALLISLARVSRETGLAETHEVTLEATHHGPTSQSKPVVFAELGSTEEDWRNPRGGRHWPWLSKQRWICYPGSKGGVPLQPALGEPTTCPSTLSSSSRAATA